MSITHLPVQLLIMLFSLQCSLTSKLQVNINSQGQKLSIHSVRFEIAPCLKIQLLNNFGGSSFCFKFDETTIAKIKNNDRYLWYWLVKRNEIISSDCVSHFLSLSNSDQLVEHYIQKISELGFIFIASFKHGQSNINEYFEDK